MKNKKLLIFSCIALFVTVFLFINKVGANPSYFASTAQTATATTSPAYMAVGAATSTLTYDSYYLNTLGSTAKSDQASLLMQFTGSSTLSVLNINVEYSHDGVDWYADNIYGQTGGRSVATGALSIGTANSMTWTFASSTRGGAALSATNGATSTKAVIIDTPTRYTRVIFSMTGDRGAVWSQIVPVKEKTER